MCCSATQLGSSLAGTSLLALLFSAAPCTALAGGIVSIVSKTPGPTPFIEFIRANLTGAPLANVSFAVLPKTSSATRPIVASYSVKYLVSQGDVTGNTVNVPIFGLYAGSNNTVALLFTFQDGSAAVELVPISTEAYTDPCGSLNAPVLQQNRRSVRDLSYDYVLLKDFCSINAPAILDTDGNIRWVGKANLGSIPAIFYDNGIYTSDGATGVNRLELTGGVTKIGDYAAAGVTFTGHHNFDPGRNGIVIEVNTTTQTEATDLEIDGAGKVLNSWDLGQIIGTAMSAGGDDPSKFVLPVGTDWFHNNATAYNPADNTLIVSSRENFVMAVDYDTPSDGVKKIHWILGDTTKAWYQFRTLRRFAVTLAPGTVPPIGQHAVSIDHEGNLLLFDDGQGSTVQLPAGLTRSYSAARSYRIDTVAMTATAVFTYVPQPSIFSPFCGSVYEPTPGNYLLDFATADNETQLILQGLGKRNKLVFNLEFAETETCGAGWNAIPIMNQPLHF